MLSRYYFNTNVISFSKIYHYFSKFRFFYLQISKYLCSTSTSFAVKAQYY